MDSVNDQKNKQIEPEIDYEKMIKQFSLPVDPVNVKSGSKKELSKIDVKSFKVTPESNTFKALTLNEFQNGMLMSTLVAEHYQTFIIDYSRKLQAEFNCNTAIERSLCEFTAINYVRSLEVQRKINNLFNQNGLTRIDIHYFSLLSKELDRAQRHFFTSLQTLKTIKQPAMQLNIKTETAVIGTNQIVQNRNE